MSLKGSSSRGHYLRGMIWSLSGNIIGIVASAATIIMAIRMLDKSQMGAYFLTMLVANFSIVLGDLGLINTTIRFLSRTEEKNKLSNYVITIRLIFSVLTCLVLLILMPFLFRIWPSEEFSRIGFYCVPMVFLMMIYQLGLALFSGYQMFGNMSVFIAVTEIFRMIISLYLLYIGFGAKGLLIGMIATHLIGIFVIIYLLPFRVRVTLQHKNWREVLKFGGWIHGSSVMSVVTIRSADAILTTYLGPIALAVYSTASQIPIMMRRLFGTIKPVMLGYISSLKMEAARASVTSVRLLACFLSAFAAFIIVVAKPLILLLYTPKYFESIPILQILCLWSCFGMVNHFLSLTLTGMGRIKLIFLLQIPQFIMIVSTGVILIPVYKGFGASISLLLSSMLGIFLQIWAVAGKDDSLHRRLHLAFFRSVLPLMFLVIIELFFKPSLLINLTLFFIFISILFILKSITLRDVKILLAHTLHKQNY